MRQTEVTSKGTKGGSDMEVVETCDKQKGLVVCDFTDDDNLRAMTLCRETANRAQRLRKKAKLVPDDPIDICFEAHTERLKGALKSESEYLSKCLRRQWSDSSVLQGHESVIAVESYEFLGESITVRLVVQGVHFNKQLMNNEFEGDARLCECVLSGYDVSKLSEILNTQDGVIVVEISNKKFSLQLGKHFALRISDKTW
eukprot:GHVR01082592.1.p1 GENE.GHVR01082592.1~~GHVR01082592.1.p1  ORF type:complete len:200 (+),score=56.85 GHVR01082592.1:114-713(+)